MMSINLQAVVDSEYPAVVRLAAKKLQETPYTDVGSFLKKMNKADLAELVWYCNAITMKVDTGDMLDSIVLLGEMLAQAEGISIDQQDVMRTSNLMILLTFEDLYRKGVIEFCHEYATLSGDLTRIPQIARLKNEH